MCLAYGKLFSQDTLPRFTLEESANKVVISWTNPYPNVVQLNVQRSFDSLKYFTTIFSATSPALPQNGYSDNKQPANRVYYRIFYSMAGGSYFFTRSKRANGSYENSASADVSNSRDLKNARLSTAAPGDKRIVTIKIKDVIYEQLPNNAFLSFRDSILHQTKDTLFSVNDSLVGLNPYVSREPFRISSYVYVNKDGYINISLPQLGQKKYNLKFFEENGSPLFDVRTIKESPLIIDKSNFVHAGWFLFELYEDNKLKEKNKFYLPKDF